MEQELIELSSGPLETRALAASVADILAFFEATNSSRVRVMLGWACNLPIEELWNWREIPLNGFEDFVARNTESGVFELGRSDLFIEDLAETAQFLLCHEGDLHFLTADSLMAARVQGRWKQKGFKFATSKVERAGPGLNYISRTRQWCEVD